MYSKKGGDFLKLKVIKKYVDKYTHEMIHPGEILDDVSEERAAELHEAGVAQKYFDNPFTPNDDNTASEA